MREDVDAVLASRAPGPSGLSRVIKWSFAVHVGVALSVLAWQAFLSRSANHAKEMTISLSGPVGPSTGGLTAMGGRQVDVATPQPRKPDTPVPPKPDVMPIPTKSVVKPPTTATHESSVTQSSVVTPAATGRQVATGSSVVETGARGESVGLSQGGGAGAKVDPEFEFCCKEYLTQMLAEVTHQVNWAQPSHGNVILKFEISSDGKIAMTSVAIEKSSGASILDIDAQRALAQAHLPPLPKEYKFASLTVHLTFPY